MNDTPPPIQPESGMLTHTQHNSKKDTTRNPKLIANNRPGRTTHRKSTDNNPDLHYGDSVHTKQANHLRIFFQNTKGLTYSKPPTDFEYYFSNLHDIKVDIAGMAETNIAWQHHYIRSELSTCVRKLHGSTRLSYGYPNTEIDPMEGKDTYHAGGSVTAVLGPCSSMTFGPDLVDPTGLGRWSGCTIRGKHNKMVSIITAYRVCATTVNAAPRGSTFTREYDYLRSIGCINPNPRRHILDSLRAQIHTLRQKGHSILLMMDANTELQQDRALLELIHDTGLHDLHSSHPAPTTYIGSATRRIDYMFGCEVIHHAMAKSGTLSYLDGPQSDHRGLFVDLDPSGIFGIPKIVIPPITPHFTRFLKSANPEHVAIYNTAVLEYYKDHNMIQRLEDLHNKAKHLPLTTIRKRLEKWDRDQGRAMKHAELQLQKPPAKYPWSPKLRNAGLTRRYWRLRFREGKYNEDHTTSIRTLLHHVQQNDQTFFFPQMDQPLELNEIHQHMKAAMKHLRQIQRTALESRYQSYQALLHKYAMDTNQDTRKESNRRAKVIRSTISAEKCRSMFQHIRKHAKPAGETQNGITKILVPSIPGEQINSKSNLQHTIATHTDEEIFWETVIDRKEMEDYLLRYNQRSFRAASISPCGHGPIYDDMTFTGISLSADQLLSGTIPPEWDTDHTPLLNDFLLSFARPDQSEAIPNTSPEDTFIEQGVKEDDIHYGFKSWKEKTSTSPSGRHLGHYRSLIQDKTLLTCLTQFMNIAIRSGISISRWSEAINVLIEKDPGQPKITRLRINHLFEADLNLYLKLQWGHQLVRHALKKNLIHPGQHGSVPGKTTMDPIMLNQLTTDLCRLTKSNYAHFDNDASACYDRIIVPLAMLAARRCGMQQEAVQVHATTLQRMRYKVKTAYGISEDTYTGNMEQPLFGTGQGSGASPAAWLTLVVVLMYTLERVTSERVRFYSPDTDKVHERILDAYVDDTALSFTTEADGYGELNRHNLETPLTDTNKRPFSNIFNQPKTGNKQIKVKPKAQHQ